MNHLEPMGPQYQSVNRAFSKQSVNYDVDDHLNIVLQDMRWQVYEHLSEFLKPHDRILELNAGTGIDALYFAKKGYAVHATDLSDGMIAEIEKKIKNNTTEGRLTCQQLSYDRLDSLNGEKFDYIFSNFGGLNCIDDLTLVTKNLPALLNPGARVTWVIMPPVCMWELLSVTKGNTKQAFRRFRSGGVMAHLEGEYFKTFYHSINTVKNAFSQKFEFLKSEGLCALSPPPSRGDFAFKHPGLYRILRKLDSVSRHRFPFNRWADHIIVTFSYTK